MDERTLKRLRIAARHHERRLREPWYYMHRTAKHRAKTLGIPFDVTLDDIREVWPKDNCCPVLGVPFTLPKNGRRTPTSPSIDRIDPLVGYVRGNIAVISMRVNVIKQDCFEPEVFRKIATWLDQMKDELEETLSYNY